ncbi:MAG: nitrilase family protein [Muribaculaceae bacterium]|nr:nitrilase family protein [Muribaculaceae bacterium]
MLENKLKLCLVPMEILWGDKEKNLNTLEEIFEKIHPETDLVVLPETFSTGFPSSEMQKQIANYAESKDGPTLNLLRKLSKEHNLAIAGSLIAKEGNNLLNRSFFLESSGDEYFSAKKHLFSPGGEDKIFKSGSKRLSVRYRGWNISMIVCYDLRFPVWCRNCNNEYDLLIAIANWPVSRIDTWDTLLKARALENSAYVCGVNCRGIDDLGGDYNGSSHVFNYKGKDLAVDVSEDGLLYAGLSLQRLKNFRDKFPTWKDADDFLLK